MMRKLQKCWLIFKSENIVKKHREQNLAEYSAGLLFSIFYGEGFDYVNFCILLYHRDCILKQSILLIALASAFLVMFSLSIYSLQQNVLILQ